MIHQRCRVGLGGSILRRIHVWGLLAVLALIPQVLAQQASTQTVAPTLAELQTRLKRAQSETELDSMTRQKVVELYQAAIERLEIANEAAAKAKSFQERIASIADDIRKSKVKLASIPEESDLTVTDAMPLEELERLLADRQKLLDDSSSGLRAQADALETEIDGRMARVEAIMNELSEIEERIASIEEELAAGPTDGESREVSHARRLLLLTRQQRAAEELASLEIERTWCESNDAADLLRLQRDIILKQISLVDGESDVLQSAIEYRRSSEADRRIREAELVVTRTSSSAKPVAEQNLELARESKTTAEALAATTRRRDLTKEALESLEGEFDNTRQMVDAVGLTESIGLLLRQQRARLGDTRSLEYRIDQRGETVRETKLRVFQIEAELAALRDLDAASLRVAHELMAGATSGEGTGESHAAGGDLLPATTRPKLDSKEDTIPRKKGNPQAAGTQRPAAAIPKGRVRETDSTQLLADEVKPLLERRRTLLEQLNDDHNENFKTLVALDNGERMLLSATRKYAEYIDERVLWIRTGAVFGGAQVAKTASNSTWLLDRNNWFKVGDALKNDVSREPLPYAVALFGLLAAITMRWSMRSQLRSLGARASEVSCRDLLPTLQAIVLTVALSALLPVGLAFFGWRLDHSASASKFVHAVAAGLLRAASFAVPFELLRLITSRGGLAEQHFDWSPEVLSLLRRHLRWFMPVGIVLVGLVGMIEANADEQRSDSLGRAAFMAFATVLAGFCVGTLRKAGSRSGRSEFSQAENQIPSEGNDARTNLTGQSATMPQQDRRAMIEAEEADAWMNRLYAVGCILGMVVPFGLLVLGWSGYFYTALQLSWRLLASAWLGACLLLVRDVVLRWITLERRRMAQLQAEELQAISEAGKTPETGTNSPFLFPRWTWPDFRMNLTQIVTQIRSLLDTGLLTIAAVGLWFVWADVAPALHILDRVPLWQTTVEEVVESKGADDKVKVEIVKRPKAVTAANLGLGLLVMAIAIIAGRNIPGLVEVILLEHLSVDAGVRFATTCLVRYVIFIAGVCLAFNQIGIGWNSVQWLVAAASVGLGFGLQEIFANFVSGIILLFERPMRVGDVVTVGDTTGTVSRIRFRATTIIDGDRKELIVPNKSFITGNLLNWTLSDSINRLAIRIFVSPNNDPNRVRDLMLKLAGQHPLLLKDPAPSATLEEISSGGLLFVLRAFLPTLKDRAKASNDLHTIIHTRFREEGIEMPRSSQDIFVRMLDEHDQHGDSRSHVTEPHISLDATHKPARVNVT